MILLVLIQTKVETQYQSEDDDDGQTDEEAPPFEFAGAAGVLDTFVELDVAGFGVVLNVFGVLFGLLDGLVLEDDLSREVFHELLQFHHCSLDLLDVVVPGADGAKHGVGCCRAIRLKLQVMKIRMVPLSVISA